MSVSEVKGGKIITNETTNPTESQVLLLACLYNSSIYKNEKLHKPGAETTDPIQHFVILTTDSAPAPHLAKIHHRMPVFLDPSKTLESWLDAKTTFAECLR